MAIQKNVLGKGLEALLDTIDDEKLSEEIVNIDLDSIESVVEQPRKYFDKNKIASLADSIKRYGVLQPIIVKKDNGKFKIIAGERRWRAAKIAGLEEIPAIVKEDINEVTMFEMSLIENLQREDLNPIEEANGYKKLIEAFNYTHDKLAKLIGKDRSFITNSIRLLKLIPEVQDLLINGKISVGHAKLLASLSPQEQLALSKVIIEKLMTVRDLEKLLAGNKKSKKKKTEPIVFKDEIIKVSKRFNTKVDIKMNKKNNGKIILFFKNKEEFEKLIKELTC